MIKKSFFIFLLFLICIPKSTFALVATPSATTEISEMKDKIASKVAEITVTSEITTRGRVKSVNRDNKTFELQTSNNTYTVLFTEKTDFFWIKVDNKSKLTLAFGNIEPDDVLIVTGQFVKDLNEITAEKIYGKTFARLFIGKMSEFDKNSVEIKTLSSNTKYEVDFGNLTVLKIINSKSEKEDGKISDLKKDNLIMIKGTIKNAKTNLIAPQSVTLIQN